jgi:hypothetical protein
MRQSAHGISSPRKPSRLHLKPHVILASLLWRSFQGGLVKQRPNVNGLSIKNSVRDGKVGLTQN